MRLKPILLISIILVTCALVTSFLIKRQSIRSTFASGIMDKTTVVIDPGHGGEDGGAKGPDGVVEKGINLSISNMLNELLGFYGISTVMTRTQDISIHSDDSVRIRQRKASDIINRVKLVNGTKNAALISVHLNSFPQQSCWGAQVFYSPNNPLGKDFAETVQKTLKSGLNDGNQRIAKKAEERIYIMKNVECPAILVECGFLSNYSEASKLVTENYQRKLAVCITGGYLTYSIDK